MRMVRYLVVLLVLGIAGPALLLAQSSSLHTPTPPSGTGTIKVIVNVKSVPNVNTGPIGLVGTDVGSGIAKKVTDAICSTAVAQGYSCTGAINPFPGTACTGGGSPDCCNVLATDTVFYTCTLGGIGFNISRVGGTDSLTASQSGGTVLLGLNSQTNTGNNVGEDILPNYLVQVLPNGTNGVVTFRVLHSQGGANPRSFTVDTGSFTTLTDQANEIRDKFNATGLTGLTAVTRIGKLDAELYAANPQEFIQAPFTHVSVGAGIQEIQVDALPGQIVIQENNSGSTPVPALSPWGVFALVLTILLASLWFIRRRARMAQA